MFTDIYTVVWKEWKEILSFKEKGRGGLRGMLIMVLVFSIVMPIQSGMMWIKSAVPLGTWLVIPLLLISSLVADSFAGERERHTLETLLASRLSDRAILLGKLFASVSYVWILTQVMFLIALIPLNIMHWDGKILVYPAQIALSGIGLSLLMSLLMGNIGILVSLRASTVKQAQQALGNAVFVFAWGLPMLGIFLLRFVPEETREVWLAPILNGEIGSIALLALVVTVVLNLVLFGLTQARFKRTRLLLD